MRSFIAIICICAVAFCHAQTFNLRYDILTSGFWETPWAIETTSGNNLVLFTPHQSDSGWVNLGLLEIGSDGIIITTNDYAIPEGLVYAGLANCSDKTSAGNFILGNTFDQIDTTRQLGLVLFNESGDSLWTRKWYAQAPYENNIGYAAIETTDGGFLVVGTTYNDESSKVLAIKTDAEGNEIWYKTYSGFSGSESHNAALSACNSGDGGYIIGANSRACNDCVANQYFFKVDSLGVQQWETILNGETSNGSVRVLNYGNGGYYGSGQIAFDVLGEDAKPWLMKFNENGDTLWTRTFGEEIEFARYFSHPKKLSDGNLLLGGQWPGEGFDKGFLMKLDTAGNVIWDRKFYNVDGNHCRFTDYIELSDGYIVACGMANGSNELNLNQDSWVVKVDACGCLVPGCENGADCSQWVGLNDDPLNHELQQSFMIYPNPVRQILNVYLPPTETTASGQAFFEIQNLQGQLLRSFEAQHSDTTYMTDVGALASGTYLLIYRVNGEVLQVQRFVKVND